MRTISITAITAILTFALASALFASVSFTPPGGTQEMMMSSIPLLGQHAAPKASGTVSVVSDKDKNNCMLTVQVKSLTPGKVYTVQFVKTVKSGGKTQMTMQGVGAAPHRLTVDSKGTGQMMDKSVSCADVLKWPAIEVFLHPDGNPSSKNMVPVLRGDLSKLEE